MVLDVVESLPSDTNVDFMCISIRNWSNISAEVVPLAPFQRSVSVIDWFSSKPKNYWSRINLIAAYFVPIVLRKSFPLSTWTLVRNLHHSIPSSVCYTYNGIMRTISLVLFCNQRSSKLLFINLTMYRNKNINVLLSFERTMARFSQFLIFQSVCLITI